MNSPLLIPLKQVNRLLQVADQCRDFIDQADDGNPCMVHVVLPDRRADRQPWIEIRCVHGISSNDEEEIEHRWPDVEFEIVYTDEENL